MQKNKLLEPAKTFARVCKYFPKIAKIKTIVNDILTNPNKFISRIFDKS